MFRECFLYSQGAISSKPSSNMIYLRSNDAKFFVCKQIPHFAYFKIPINLQHSWVFYANNDPITINIDDLVSVPFYKLQNLFNNSEDKSKKEVSKTNREIFHALCNSLDVWFHNNDENLSNDDIIIFFKIISTNFSFNHFSSIYNKMNRDVKLELNANGISNQIEITFKKFLLYVRPNGKPNTQPLFDFSSSFLMFSYQLKYSEYFRGHQKFILNGFHYILEYLHNDNEWGPYSVLSFVSRQLGINHIQSYPLNNYNIDQNPEFYFDKRNLKCIEECASIYGELCLLWCYNPYFHHDIINIAKKVFRKSGKKINRNNLFDIISCRICHDKKNEFTNDNINDYSSFYKFVQIISPETDNIQIFYEIYEMFSSNNSENPMFLPFQFKLFYESEIKGQISKRAGKPQWINFINEQESVYSFTNDINTNKIDNLHFFGVRDDFKQKDENKVEFNVSSSYAHSTIPDKDILIKNSNLIDIQNQQNMQAGSKSTQIPINNRENAFSII